MTQTLKLYPTAIQLILNCSMKEEIQEQLCYLFVLFNIKNKVVLNTV